MGRVILIRHTEVAAHWKGRCYGQSDVGLSAAGRFAAHALSKEVNVSEGAVLVASPLRRARFLAGLIARQSCLQLTLEPRLAECHFGAWEGRPWNDIYAETGTAMMGMVTSPNSFRPGGGETTFELRDRAMAWLSSLPRSSGTVIAVAHGGTITAILGTLNGKPVHKWPSLVPAYGTKIEINV